MNPYWGVHFFEFFAIFFRRLIRGECFTQTASDELQIAVLSLLAIACGLVGPFLVLRKMAMFANSLSHTILLGIAGAFLVLGGQSLFDLSHLLLGALLAALATALCTEGLLKMFRLTEDASVSLVFTSMFALGILLVTCLTRDVHLGMSSVMGNVDALSVSDLSSAALLAAVNLVAIVLLYRPLQIASFDPCLAKILKIACTPLHFFFLFLVAATCVVSFRAVGVILVLAFLMGPFLTARIFCHRLALLLFFAPLFGIFATLFGIAFARHCLSAYHLPLSSGGLVVSFLGLFYFLALGGLGFVKKMNYTPSGPKAPKRKSIKSL